MANPYVRLLGTSEVRSEDVLIDLPTKHLALLALLVLRHPSGISRDRLCRLLWPVAGSRSARHSLSQALYSVRKRLGSATIEVVGDQLLLGAVDSDVIRFREALRHNDTVHAREQYRGDLGDIPGLGAEFEHLLDRERAQLSADAQVLLEDTGDGATARAAEDGAGGISFIGRQAELRSLNELYASVSGGPAQVAIIAGEAGIGKSTLSRRFARRCALKRARVIDCSGYELEANLPYGFVVQILSWIEERGWLADRERERDLIRLRRALRGELQGDQPDLSPLMLGSAMSQIVDELSDAVVVLVIDDYQWIDPASATLLHYVLRSNEQRQLLTVINERPREDAISAERLWKHPHVLRLRGLGKDETEYLVRRERPDAGDSTVEQVWELTSGNPLLIRSLLDGGAPIETLPDSARALFRSQIAALSRSTVVTGGALAAAGVPIALPELASIAELPPEQVESSIEVLKQHGFARQTPEGEVRAAHDMIAEELLSAVPPASRAVLHSRAGRVLVDQGASAAILATQFSIAGNQTEAYKTALEAAEASVKLHAFAEAEHFLRVAISQADSDLRELAARNRLAEVLLIRDRPEEAAALLEQTLSEDLAVPVQERGECAILHLLAELKSGRRSNSLGLASATLARLSGIVPDELALRGHIALATTSIDLGDRAVALEHVHRSKELLDNLSHDASRMSQMRKVQTLEALINPDVDTEAFLDDLPASVTTTPVAHVQSLVAFSIVCHTRGRTADAETALVEALGLSERYQVYQQLIAIRNNLAVCLMEQGRWTEAEEQLNAALAPAHLAPRHELLSVYGNRAILFSEIADSSRALEASDHCLAIEPNRQPHRASLVGLAVRGMTQLALGRLADARAAERTLRITLPVGKWWSNDISFVEIFLSRMAAVGGSAEDAVERLNAQLSLVSPNDFFGKARMEIEAMSLEWRTDTGRTLERATELRTRLARARAVPLVEKLDGIIARCRAESAESS